MALTSDFCGGSGGTPSSGRKSYSDKRIKIPAVLKGARITSLNLLSDPSHSTELSDVIQEAMEETALFGSVGLLYMYTMKNFLFRLVPNLFSCTASGCT